MTNTPIELWTAKDQFGVRIPQAVVDQMIAYCLASHPLETGGILVGKYISYGDCADVVTASCPPHDSKRGSTWFIRGTRNLQRWLDLLWKKREQHYLGEWHYHPSAGSQPSRQDKEQIRKIARNMKARCPEPLLIIIGGDTCDGFTLSCFVSPAGRSLLPMLPGVLKLKIISNISYRPKKEHSC